MECPSRKYIKHTAFWRRAGASNSFPPRRIHSSLNGDSFSFLSLYWVNLLFLITAQRTSTELMDRAVPSPYPKGRSHEGAFMDSRHDLQFASHLRQKREVNTDFQPSISSLNSWMRYSLVFSRTSVSSDWLANIQLRSSHRIQNFCNTFTCQIPVEIPRIQCPVSPMMELTGIH